MASLNKVFLIGRLTQDPDLRFTNTGSAVTDLRLAVNRTWQSKDGETKEDTLFIDVTVWNKQAELSHKSLKKGSQVHVEGYLKSESWESQTGEKRSKIKVEAQRVQFLDRRDSGGAEMSDDEDYAPPPRERRSAPAGGPAPARSGGYTGPASSAARRAAEPTEEDEDIPF
jgi:single-strand DNA-binding protein